MVEGLEVIIKYRGAKYNQVASPTSPSSEFAILKKDLAHLRVHSPSQKNVRRVNGSFILHWPTAGTSPKVAGLADSLHMRWFKLCSDDPEALKLREFLSIESITLTQDGVLIRSTAGAVLQASQAVPSVSLVERLNVPLPEMAQQPAPVPTKTLSSPVKPQPPTPAPPASATAPAFLPPPRLPPSAPRLDRHPPHLKRRLSVIEGPSIPTRQKLDAPEVQTTAPLRSNDTQLQQTHLPTCPRTDRQRGSSTPDAVKVIPQLTQDQATSPTHTPAPTLPTLSEPQTIPPSPPREPGEMTPYTPLPIPTPIPGRSPLGLTPRAPPPHHPTHSNPAPASPYPSSSSSANGDAHASRWRDRDVSRLTRELWDTRRQLTAMQAREQVILDDLERLGSRPEGAGAGVNRNGVSQDELLRLETELKTEKTKRVRAERALSDVERECRAPFVVPALYQAFMKISELSN